MEKISVGTKWTNDGNKVTLNRLFKSSPDYTAPSLIKVGDGTTTPTTSDTDLDNAVELTAGVSYANFSSGYPLLDESNFTATVRAFITSLQANGESLSEFGIFNSDATKKMLSRTVHTVITKTSAVEVSYVQKDKLA